MPVWLNLKKAVSHREHRDHRGETNGCQKIVAHLSGKSAKQGEAISFSVFSVNSVASINVFTILPLWLNLKKAVSHREHRDHRGETNGCRKIVAHLSGKSAKQGEAISCSVFSVKSVA